ncbi:Voltage-gated ion channel, partial [Globisporangium splendens]
MELKTALSRQTSEPAVAATDMEMATECVRSNEARRHSDKDVTMMHSAAAIIKSAPSLDAKPLDEQNLHHLAVLKKHLFLRQFHGRASTGSIAGVTVAAGSPTANKSAGKEDQRYEKMMERFQVRRLQSSSAVGATDSHNASMRDLRRGSVVLQQHQIGAQRASGSKPTSSIAESTERPTTLSPSKYGRMSGSLLETRATVVDLSTTINRHSNSVNTMIADEEVAQMSTFQKLYDEILTSDVTDQDNEEAYAIYASNFYDALHLLQGQGVATATLGQNVFASCAVLVGSIVLAIIFGHVAVLVSNFNANSTNYQRKMESVFAIMTKMQLPAPLRERIHQYYEHLWREYESLDGEIGRFSKDFSHALELEVVLFKYIELIMHIPFWKECTPDFQKQLMLNLHVRVYLPDDFIIRRGEVGDEFYMINHGSCELASSRESVERATVPIKKKRNTSAVSDFQDFVGTSVHPIPTTREDKCDSDSESDGEGDTKLRKPRAKRSIYRTENLDDDPTNPLKSARASKSLKKLSRGQAFGEMALLMNYQRTANVRAITYVEMCVLNRSDFHRILSRYPDDWKRVTLHILTNCMEKNESSQVHCPFKEVVASVYGGGADSTPITARFAAEMIARTVNPDLEDDSIKFGITTKLTEQLIELREREAKQTIELRATTDASVVGNKMSLSHPVLNSDSSANMTDNATATRISPSLLARIELIEDTQEQVLRCVNEINGIISEIKNARAATDRGTS